MVLSKQTKTDISILQREGDTFKGLKTPLVTAVARCNDKHLLVAQMLKENGLPNAVEPRDDKTFKVYTLKGARVLSYLDAFFNGKKVIKYIRRQDATN